MIHWTKKVQFLVYGPIWLFFFFDLEIRCGFHFRYWILPQITHWNKKFVIMIRCKINFHIIYYTVISTTNLYLSIFVWYLELRFYEYCHSCFKCGLTCGTLFLNKHFYNNHCTYVYLNLSIIELIRILYKHNYIWTIVFYHVHFYIFVSMKTWLNLQKSNVWH